MNDKKNLRTKLRKEIRHKRRSLTAAFQQESAIDLINQLKPWFLQTKPQKIALYLANDGELCTKPLIEYCWQHNVQVYLPVLHPFSKGHLLFLAHRATTQMQNNQYGIAEPILDVTQVCPASHIDVIFTPLVAFDDTGARLGMGGGFYDRTLAQLERRLADTQVVGLAHDCQRIEQVPIETWDMPLKQIFTPTRRYTF